MDTAFVVDNFVLTAFSVCGNHWVSQSTLVETALSVYRGLDMRLNMRSDYLVSDNQHFNMWNARIGHN